MSRKIAAVEVNASPIFVIGHWRSGTTYLHNLLSQDQQWGYTPMALMWTPDLYLSNQKIVDALINFQSPEKRPMDNVEMRAHSAYEEEYGIAHLSPYSFYHGYYFPKKLRQLFNQYVMFEGVGAATVEKWKQVYLNLLKRTTLYSGGKRLLLKNPVNTARVKLLLQMFPNAKFVHIYRNPFDVYYSTQKLFRDVLQVQAFHDYDLLEVEAEFVVFYQQLMQKFFAEQHLIPEGNLIEVRYEDLEEEPIAQLERIYQALDLPGFEQAEISFKAYIASQSNYVKNRYIMTHEAIEKVVQHWQFTIDRWGYAIPETATPATTTPATTVPSSLIS